ncbi:MAG TPA: LptF/LptG family permease [Trueperaceae bacterium]
MLSKRFSLYLVREIFPLYVAGLSALILLLLAAFLLEVAAEILARGTSPALVAQFLFFKLPEAAGYGIPLALLFASLLGLTRLGQDGEIKAGLLLGFSPRQFAIPIVLLGLIVTGLSFVNNELVIPWSSQHALEVQKDILIQRPEAFLEEGEFFTDALGRQVFVRELQPGGVARGITVIQSGGSAGADEVIQAKRGILDQQAGLWRLEDVRFLKYRDNQVVLDMRAARLLLPVRGLSAGSSEPLDLTRLPFGELWRRIRGSPGGNMAAEWTALNRKFAEPAAATAFALFALAVALYTFRSNQNLGFVSVLFLTFLYYATWSVSKLLGAQGTIPAWLAGWSPVALYAVAGAVLLTLSWRR